MVTRISIKFLREHDYTLYMLNTRQRLWKRQRFWFVSATTMLSPLSQPHYMGLYIVIVTL